MAIVWLIYFLALMVFFIIGATCVYHARKYGLAGDFTTKAATIYILIMVAILAVSLIVVFSNGVNASFDIKNNVRINNLK